MGLFIDRGISQLGFDDDVFENTIHIHENFFKWVTAQLANEQQEQGRVELLHLVEGYLSSYCTCRETEDGSVQNKLQKLPIHEYISSICLKVEKMLENENATYVTLGACLSVIHGLKVSVPERFAQHFESLVSDCFVFCK